MKKNSWFDSLPIDGGDMYKLIEIPVGEAPPLLFCGECDVTFLRANRFIIELERFCPNCGTELVQILGIDGDVVGDMNRPWEDGA